MNETLIQKIAQLSNDDIAYKYNEKKNKLMEKMRQKKMDGGMAAGGLDAAAGGSVPSSQLV